MAPSLHNICWRGLERHASVDSLSNFAYALLPSLHTMTSGNIHGLSNDSVLSVGLKHLCESHDDLRQGSELFNSLDRLRKLPEEITLMILKSLPLTIVRCLISMQATVKLMNEASLTRHRTGVILLHGTLTAFFRPLFGDNYISGIQDAYQLFGHRGEDYQQVKIESPVVAVSSIVGLFGVRGIEYLMRNGNKGYFGYPNGRCEHTRRTHITSRNNADPRFLKLEGDVKSSFRYLESFICT